MPTDAPFNPHDEPVAPGLFLPRSVLRFTFSRSGGPGGQNVNKINSKATLNIPLEELAAYLPADVLERFRAIAAGSTTAAGVLQISSDESRSQHANRAECIAKLRELIVRARVRPKRRRKTKPSRGSKERRLQAKKERGQIKSSRRQHFE